MVNKGDKGGAEGSLDDKLAQNKKDMEQLVRDGISDIKNILGEKFGDISSKVDVCSKVLRDIVVDTRMDEYKRQVDDKLARNAVLVFSRPNGGVATPTSAEELWKFIHSLFPAQEVPGFIVEPMGKQGSYRVFPETFSPVRSRQICANILHLLKDSDFKTKFGLNAFYDNPFYLRKIHSTALRFTATLLQAEGMKLGSKPFVKKGVMLLDGVPVFSECLVPEDETFWDPMFPIIAGTLRRGVTLGEGDTPAAEAQMRDLFAALKGLIFPRPLGAEAAVAPSDVAM